METQETEINLNEVFFKSLVRQIRSIDSYGSFDKYSDEELVEKRYVKKDGDDSIKMDQMTLNIKLYLQTIAVTLEQIGGHIVGLMTEGGCDGSVKAVIYSGQLILMDKTFGGVSGLQFGSLEKLSESGGKLLRRLEKIMSEKVAKYKELMG